MGPCSGRLEGVHGALTRADPRSRVTANLRRDVQEKRGWSKESAVGTWGMAADSRSLWREGQAEGKTAEVSGEAGPSVWPQGT